MAAEDEGRTEEPTSKKIEDARKEGNVPKSQDVISVVVLAVGFLTLYALFPYVSREIELLWRFYMSFIGKEITYNVINEILLVTLREIVFILAPLLFPILIAGIGSHLAQFGFNFTTKAITPNLNKINPVKGLMNLFSLEKIFDGGKLTLKVFTAFGIGFYMFLGYIKELTTVSLFNFGDQLLWLADKILLIIMIMIAIFIVYAAIDLFFVRRRYTEGLKMTKNEVKDEFKNMEGNPEIKGKIRQMMFQMSRKRMMSEIPKASVVVTNPTHYAVAIRYLPEKDNAPMVIASGVDSLAQRIKEKAREFDIPIVENPPLARDLYASVKPGEAIPERLFKAVAELLAYVYKINQNK